MLVYSPDNNPTRSLATGANLIDIEDSFTGGACGSDADMDRGPADADGVPEEDEANSGTVSDESMNRLLHGRKARNPYQ